MAELCYSPPRLALAAPPVGVHDRSIWVPSGSIFVPSKTREGLCRGVSFGGGRRGRGGHKEGRDHEDQAFQRRPFTHAMCHGSKHRCADRRACTSISQDNEFSCRVARGPQPAQAGHRCRGPLDADACHAGVCVEEAHLGRERCRPGWTACRRQLQVAIRSSRPRRRSLPASALATSKRARRSASAWVPLAYPTPMDRLCGNHRQDCELEPRRAAVERQRHDLEPVKWPLRDIMQHRPRRARRCVGCRENCWT